MAISEGIEGINHQDIDVAVESLSKEELKALIIDGTPPRHGHLSYPVLHPIVNNAYLKRQQMNPCVTRYGALGQKGQTKH
jgi:hypothetical protein